MRMYVLKNPPLLSKEVDLKKFKKGTTYSILFGPVLYLIGALVSFIHSYISFVIYFGIALYFIFPHSFDGFSESISTC